MAGAQEFDTANFAHARRNFTILDEAGTPEERAAFERLFKSKSGAGKWQEAQAFLERHPASWFLAQVHEIAAKAAIDEGDFARAVEHGRMSLRIVPENPLLLAPLANVQLQQGLLDEAMRNARAALECLDRFGAPAAMDEKEWDKVADQLRASAYFVLGRAAATAGLALSDRRRGVLLFEAESALLKARDLNPEDAQTHFVLGLVAQARAQPEEAVVHFYRCWRIRSPVQEKALAQLKQLHGASPFASTTWDKYLERLSAQAPFKKGTSKDKLTPKPAGEYAGTDACRDCHSDVHAAWAQTGMARMFRQYRPENVLGDFEKNNNYADDGGFEFARMIKNNGRHFFEMRQSEGPWKRYPVDFTIGSKWQQAYATRLPSGAIHVFPIQYSAVHGRWLNFWKIIDPPGSERTDILAFHKLGTATAYQSNCTPCHTSQLRQARLGEWAPEKIVFREGGVNCEMCHGPSAQHVDAMRSGRAYAKGPLDPPISFRRISHKDFVAICAQCHMQSALREQGPNGELNYSPHAPFFSRHTSRPYTEFSRKAFYKDGRFRETTFIVEAFLRSDCYRKGQAHCGYCHNPHPADAASNPKSLKFPDNPDRMCLQCHASYATDIASHTRHPADSEASRCVSCHMPRIMNSVLFQARSHQIGEIPDAEMTARFGPQESPNGCLECHSTRDAAWMREQLTAWTHAREGSRTLE